jgi:hypothetical protein
MVKKKKVIKEITDKIKSLPMSPSRLGEDEIPVTCLVDGFLL